MLRKTYRQHKFLDLWDQKIVSDDDVRPDDEILVAIKNIAGRVYRPIGTCKMGAEIDAVVSLRFRFVALRFCVLVKHPLCH